MSLCAVEKFEGRCGKTDTWLGPFGMNSAEAVIRPAVITSRRNTGNSEDIIEKLNETMDGKFEMRVVGSWIYMYSLADVQLFFFVFKLR